MAKLCTKLERDWKRGSKGDFYIAPREWGRDFVTNLSQLEDPSIEPEFQPGVFMEADCVRIHRTHLPLLRNYPGVEDELLKIAGGGPDEADRRRRETSLNIQLKPHQHEAIDFIAKRRGVLLGDQMRLKKTTTSLACHDPSRGPLVAIGPLSVRDVWLRWMRTIWPGIEPRVIAGKKYETGMFDYPIVFCHDEIAAAHQSAAIKIGTLIVDEAHRISNPKAERTKAIMFWASKAQQVLLLTGTPLWNQPPGLWTLLSAVNPGAWGTHFQFSQRYGNPMMTEHGWRYFGASHGDELQERLREAMIARKWRDVRDDLPPTDWRIDLVPLPEEDRHRVDIAAARMRESLAHPDGGVRTLTYYKQAVGRHKVARGAELARHVLDGLKQPVVIWVWHRKVGEAVYDRLREVGHIAEIVDGDVDEADRLLAMDRWRAEEQPSAIIMTMAVGQVGIDLSHARYAIFVELDFTPATIAQAAYRTFSEQRAMTIWLVVLNHETDRQIADAIVQKMQTGDDLGVAAAEGPLDIIATAFGTTREEEHDLSRFTKDLLAAGVDLDD